MEVQGQVTQLLGAVRQGKSRAWDDLFVTIYDELKSLAGRHRRRERGNHTLQTTALVNEAFLRLVRERDRSWANRSHFLAIASTAMRRVLVDYAERRNASKRGGGEVPVALEEAVALFEEPVEDLLALNEALNSLEKVDPKKSQIVEMRFFGGLTIEETAASMEVSTRTVERGWRLARAWIRAHLDRQATEAT